MAVPKSRAGLLPSSLPGLADAAYAFHFFQAVRLLHRIYPDRAAVGRFADPSTEVVRFGSNPDLAFPAGEIQSLDGTPGDRWKMTVNFLGLVGHLGVLPDHYSVLVKRSLKARDRAPLDFLDIFHHRVVSLFYRAMERSRFYVPYERGDPDAVTAVLLDLLGIGDEATRDAMALEETDLLPYVGLLARGARSALALEQLIEDRFGVRATIEQFVGGWYDVSDTAQCRVDDGTEDYSQQLGAGALVGDEIWDSQARVRVVIGPLSRAQYDDFLPTGASYRKLRLLTRFFGNEDVEFELRLVLETSDVPPLTLGTDETPPLGWGSWIRSGSRPPESAETVLPL